MHAHALRAGDRARRRRAAAMVVGLAALLLAAPGRAIAPNLQALARDLVGASQGVFVQASDGSPLVSQEADRPVHPASVTKVPSTMTLIERLGATHRFSTRLVAAGPVHDGVLDGDLVIEAEGDPFLLPEHAERLGLELRAQGIGRIAGRLRVDGPLLFAWQPDPTGTAFRRALTGVSFGERATPDTDRVRPLVLHTSPPLVDVLKALNCYSNNVFQLLADRAGGAAAVEAAARRALPPTLAAAVTITNAAGAGTTNRLSPRAAALLVAALDDTLARHGLALTDVLPVARIDRGTLRDRLDGRVVGKTGSYGSVGASALAGALRTPAHGRVVFAVLNHGIAVPEARHRQDAFVAALADALDAEPWPYAARPLVTFADAHQERAPSPPPAP